MLGLESLTDNLPMVIKTLAKLQHLAKSNQRTIWYRLLRLNKLANLQHSIEGEQAIYKLENKNNYKNKLFLAYQYFCQSNNISFVRPRRLPTEACVITIPTEQRIYTIARAKSILPKFHLSSFGGPYVGGPYQTIDVQKAISIQPNQSFDFNITIRYVDIGSYSDGIFENNTFYFDRTPSLPSVDSWDTARFWFGLEQTNQTNDTLYISLYSLGSRVFLSEDYRFQGYTQLFRDETSQADTYFFEIYNLNSTVINPVLHVHLEWDTNEKPYFTIGIAGLLIALLSLIRALKINRKLVGLILALIGFIFMISGTILFVIQPQQQVFAPVYCRVYIGHPIYCLKALHGVFFDVGWLLIIIGSIMLIFYRKRKLWQLT